MVSLELIVEPKLEVNTAARPNVVFVTEGTAVEVGDRAGEGTSAAHVRALQPAVNLREEVDRHLRVAGHVDGLLVNVTRFVSHHPDGRTFVVLRAAGEALIVQVVAHTGIVRAVGRSIGVALRRRRGREHAVEAIEILVDAHEIAFALHEFIPALQYAFDAHRRAVDISLGKFAAIELFFHAREIHVELVILVLHVDHLVFEERFLHVEPVGVGVSASDVEITVHATAFNVDLQGGSRSEEFARVGDGVDDEQVAVVVGHHHVQAGFETLTRTYHIESFCGHGFHLGGGHETFGVDIDEGSFTALQADARGAGLGREHVARAHILVVVPLRVVRIGLVVIDAEFLFAVSPRVVLDFERHGLHRSGEGNVVARSTAGGLTHEIGQVGIGHGLELRFERRATGIGEIDREGVFHLLEVGTAEIGQFGQVVACHAQRGLVDLGLGDDPLRFGHVDIPTHDVVAAVVVESHIIIVLETIAGRELVLAFGEGEAGVRRGHSGVSARAFAALCGHITFGQGIAERPLRAFFHHLPHLREVAVGFGERAELVRARTFRDHTAVGHIGEVNVARFGRCDGTAAVDELRFDFVFRHIGHGFEHPVGEIVVDRGRVGLPSEDVVRAVVFIQAVIAAEVRFPRQRDVAGATGLGVGVTILEIVLFGASGSDHRVARLVVEEATGGGIAHGEVVAVGREEPHLGEFLRGSVDFVLPGELACGSGLGDIAIGTAVLDAEDTTFAEYLLHRGPISPTDGGLHDAQKDGQQEDEC